MRQQLTLDSLNPLHLGFFFSHFMKAKLLKPWLFKISRNTGQWQQSMEKHPFSATILSFPFSSFPTTTDLQYLTIISQLKHHNSSQSPLPNFNLKHSCKSHLSKMQIWTCQSVLWLLVAYRMKSKLFRMCFCSILFLSITCFISSSDPLFYFGELNSVCYWWDAIHGLSDSFPKDLFFLCDSGSIYDTCSTALICRDKKFSWSVICFFSSIIFLATFNSLGLILSFQSTWSTLNALCSLSSRYWYMLWHPLGTHFPGCT